MHANRASKIKEYSLIISHDSALEYWRHSASSIYDASERRKATEAAIQFLAKGSAPSVNESICWSAGISLPVHVIVSREGRTSQKLINPHQVQRIPPSAVIATKRGLWISTPEFIFLQMADKLSLVKLIQLGCELCGTYSIEPGEEASTRDYRLTSTADISSFIAKVDGSSFRQKKARRALKYVINDSASPMETILALLLSLPYSMGGYGIPKPQMNHDLWLTKQQRKSAKRNLCRCDMYWSNGNLCVEYDSDRFHTGAERIASDAARRNALADMGVDEITVTKRQLLSVSEFDGVAHQIARKIGKRLRYDEISFISKSDELRRELFEACASENHDEISAAVGTPAN